MLSKEAAEGSIIITMDKCGRCLGSGRGESVKDLNAT